MPVTMWKQPQTIRKMCFTLFLVQSVFLLHQLSLLHTQDHLWFSVDWRFVLWSGAWVGIEEDSRGPAQSAGEGPNRSLGRELSMQWTGPETGRTCGDQRGQPMHPHGARSHVSPLLSNNCSWHYFTWSCFTYLFCLCHRFVFPLGNRCVNVFLQTLS